MRKILPFLAYAILILIVFWGVLLPPEGKILFAPDIWRYHYWERQFLGAALREGQMPWWNPYIFAGQPYLEHPQIPAWYLPNLLFVFIPTNLAVSWYVALHILWAMAGMYFLVRGVKPSGSRLGAWAAGVSFGLSSYFFGRVYAGHIDVIAASAWMPWIVSANLKAQISNRKKEIVIAGVVFAMQLLSGHHMVAIYTAEAIIILATVLAAFRRSLRPLIIAFVPLIFGVALAAVQILPNQQMVARSIRTMPLGRVWSAIAAARPAHFLEFLDTGYFYKTIYKDIADDGLGHERAGYIGKIPLIMAVTLVFFVLAKRQKKPMVWAFLAVGAFGIWMWLGPNAPFDVFALMQKTLPIYGQIRIPSRHIILFVLAGSALFGIGMGRIKHRFITLFLVVAVLVDLVPLARQNIHVGLVPETVEDKELTFLVARDGGLARLLPNFYHGEPLRGVLEFDAPTVHKIFSVSGYDQPPLRNYYEFLLAVNNLHIDDNVRYIETIPPFTNIRSSYLDFLNIKYILTPKDGDSLRSYPERFSLIKENSQRGYRLYENKNVLPRFFFVKEASVLSSRAAIDRAIRDGTSDPHRSVLIESRNYLVPPASCTENDRLDIRVVEYNASTIRLATRSTCDAWLVSSEVYYPGWKAEIDGKKTQILEGNLAFRTVFVLKGTHTITMWYQPTMVVLGLLVSILTVVGCFLGKRMLLFVK